MKKFSLSFEQRWFLYFVIGFTVTQSEGCSYGKHEINKTEVTIEVDTIGLTEVDTLLWNGFRGIGNPDYKMD
tara:strand:- start:343 stop:558 length:216 start_codon:yes stop_codon:yes gene_type:complete